MSLKIKRSIIFLASIFIIVASSSLHGGKNEGNTTHTSSKKIKLSIVGSCVSRDIFGIPTNDEKHFDIVSYTARSSFGSMAAEPFPEPLPESIDQITYSFQNRMIKQDMRKTLFKELPTMEYDILLVDIIDERFKLWTDGKGRLCTVSAELAKSTFLKENKGRYILPISDEFWELWEKGWRNFIDTLKTNNRLDRVRVNKVFWSSATESGKGFSPDQPIETSNNNLARMYERMAQDLSPRQFLTFSSELLVSADSHKWGVAPFHFIDSYYQDAFQQLLTSLE